MKPGLLRLAEDPDVENALVITDGYEDYPREPVPFNVLWALTADGSRWFAPGYGTVLIGDAMGTKVWADFVTSSPTRVLRRIALVLLWVVLAMPCAVAGDRFALVVGNANYVSAPALKNPRNDAQAVAEHLRSLGFRVTLELDLDKAGFERRVRTFSGEIQSAEAVLFFYAGHGLQVDGRNYMVPVDARLADEADLPFELVSLDVVLQRLAGHRVTSIILLDACRDNPFRGDLGKALGERADAVGGGLAAVHASVGTLISFSTQPGNVALDGDGQNSPFAKALLEHIATPNVDVLDMMKRVRREVVAATREKQVPWDTSSLVDEFLFRSIKSEAAPDRAERRAPERSEPRRDEAAKAVDVVPAGRPPAHDCDRVAASASDPERVTDGVSFGQLDGAGGVVACRAALAKYPDTPRFQFQLARSLHKAGAYSEAAALYDTLVQRGYLAAYTNYGWLLTEGQGVAQNETEAVRLYLLAAHQGDAFGMFNTAMAYDSGKGLPYNPAQAAHWIYAALRLGHDYSITQMSGEAAGWSRAFRVELQRLLKRSRSYTGQLDGRFGPDVWRAVRLLPKLEFAPTPGGAMRPERWDPQSIPVNAPLPAR